MTKQTLTTKEPSRDIVQWLAACAELQEAQAALSDLTRLTTSVERDLNAAKGAVFRARNQKTNIRQAEEYLEQESSKSQEFKKMVASARERVQTLMLQIEGRENLPSQVESYLALLANEEERLEEEVEKAEKVYARALKHQVSDSTNSKAKEALSTKQELENELDAIRTQINGINKNLQFGKQILKNSNARIRQRAAAKEVKPHVSELEQVLGKVSNVVEAIIAVYKKHGANIPAGGMPQLEYQLFQGRMNYFLTHLKEEVE